MKQKLIDGYLRELETSLNDQVIPNEINRIVFSYYRNGTLICYLTIDHNAPWCIADVMSDERTVWKSKVEQSKKKSPGYTKPCFGYNISSMLSVNDVKYNTAIFHCGGYDSGLSKKCEAMLFHSKQLQLSRSSKENEDIDFMRLALPDLPKAGWGNNTVYSNQYGLFSVGGKLGKHVFNLQTQSDGKMKWEQLKNEMKNEHYYPSVCMINDEKLFVAAGDNNANVDKAAIDSKIEICDLSTDEWSQLADCTIKRCIAGIFYDSMQDAVYLGGGDGNNESSVECYDINKNVWSLLPNCHFKHEWNPAIWKDDNILYIASVEANGMEFIDLREHNTSWTVKYNEKANKLETVFNTKYDLYVQESWLLPFSTN